VVLKEHLELLRAGGEALLVHISALLELQTHHGIGGTSRNHL